MQGIYYRGSNVPSEVYTDGKRFYKAGRLAGKNPCDPTKFYVSTDVSDKRLPLLNVHVPQAMAVSLFDEEKIPKSMAYASSVKRLCFDIVLVVYHGESDKRYDLRNVVYYRFAAHAATITTMNPFRKYVFESGHQCVSDTENVSSNAYRGVCILVPETIVPVHGRDIDYGAYASCLRLNAFLKTHSVVRPAHKDYSHLVNLKSYYAAYKSATSLEAKEYYRGALVRYVDRIKFKDPYISEIVRSIKIRDAKATSDAKRARDGDYLVDGET